MTDCCRALPVFPLPRVVLMPSAVLPLHIFEPRYRALVDHVRAGDGLMGIATLQPGYEGSYGGSPAVYTEIGVGRLVQHEELPDGRSNIVLVHVASAIVSQEVETDFVFRVFDADVCDDDDPPERDLDAVRALVMQLGAANPNADAEASRLTAMPGMELVHAVARRMLVEPDRQRLYLGLNNRKRVNFVCDALASLLGNTVAIGEA